ncbi:DUF932 domain-containing protein [Parasphingorhabdus pacifica]
MSFPVNTQTEANGPLDPARLSPWRQIGAPVGDCVNARQALEKAGLAGWNIRKLKQSGTEITPDGVSTVDNPEKVMLVRNDPATNRVRYLSTVGDGYGIRQNEEQADLLDALVAESGAQSLADAGQLDDGRRTFVTMKLPETMTVAGVDPVDLYLAVFNSHDGSSAFRVMLVPFRVWCANQLGVAIRDKVSEVSIRHTRNAEIKVEDIRNKLGLMYAYAEAFESEARKMIDTELTTPEFRDIVETIWPVDDNAPTRTRNNADRRRGELMRLWRSADTQKAVRSTRWAGWQAVTEYLDHFQPAKDASVRAHRVLTSGTVADRKQRAFELLAT